MALTRLGTNAITALPAGVGGKVLQVVQTEFAANIATSSTSYVDSGIAASITPTSTSNKIYISAVAGGTTYATDGYLDISLYSQINGGGYSSIQPDNTSNPFQKIKNASIIFYIPMIINYLYSPSTTSQVDIKVYIKSVTGSTQYVSEADRIATLTLMEIAG